MCPLSAAPQERPHSRGGTKASKFSYRIDKTHIENAAIPRFHVANAKIKLSTPRDWVHYENCSLFSLYLFLCVTLRPCDCRSCRYRALKSLLCVCVYISLLFYQRKWCKVMYGMNGSLHNYSRRVLLCICEPHVSSLPVYV